MRNRSGGAARGVSDYHSPAPFKVDLTGFHAAMKRVALSIVEMSRRMVERDLNKKGISTGRSPRLGPPTDI